MPFASGRSFEQKIDGWAISVITMYRCEACGEPLGHERRLLEAAIPYGLVEWLRLVLWFGSPLSDLPPGRLRIAWWFDPPGRL